MIRNHNKIITKQQKGSQDGRKEGSKKEREIGFIIFYSS